MSRREYSSLLALMAMGSFHRIPFQRREREAITVSQKPAAEGEAPEGMRTPLLKGRIGKGTRKQRKEGVR